MTVLANTTFEQEYVCNYHTNSGGQVLAATDDNSWRLAITDPKCDIGIEDDTYTKLQDPGMLSVEDQMQQIIDTSNGARDRMMKDGITIASLTSADPMQCTTTTGTGINMNHQMVDHDDHILEARIANLEYALESQRLEIDTLKRAADVSEGRMHELAEFLVETIDEYFKQEVAKFHASNAQWANLDQPNRPSANESLNNAADQTSKHLTNGFNLKG